MSFQLNIPFQIIIVMILGMILVSLSSSFLVIPVIFIIMGISILGIGGFAGFMFYKHLEHNKEKPSLKILHYLGLALLIVVSAGLLYAVTDAIITHWICTDVGGCIGPPGITLCFSSDDSKNCIPLPDPCNGLEGAAFPCNDLETGDSFHCRVYNSTNTNYTVDCRDTSQR